MHVVNFFGVLHIFLTELWQNLFSKHSYEILNILVLCKLHILFRESVVCFSCVVVHEQPLLLMELGASEVLDVAGLWAARYYPSAGVVGLLNTHLTGSGQVLVSGRHRKRGGEFVVLQSEHVAVKQRS